MTQHLPTQLPVLAPASSGCGCCGSASDTALPAPATTTTTIATRSYGVTGLTCSHCVAAISREFSTHPGVTEVGVDLIAAGISILTITGEAPLTRDQIAAALDRAGGYQLAADPGR